MISSRMWISFFLICFLCKDCFSAVSADTSGRGIEAQAERFRQEYSVEKRLSQKKRKESVLEVREKEEKPVASEISFRLNEVRLSGTTLFDPWILDFTWKDYLGKDVNGKDLDNIVRMIKQVYREQGYLTTIVSLVPGDIRNGEVEIRVVEGKRGKLTVEGNKWFSTASIIKYFHTYEDAPLNVARTQKDIMRLNDARDLTVNAILSPGKKPETADVVLQATEVVPYHVTVGADNRGSRLTGRYRKTVAVNTSNLTGNHDDLYVSGIWSASSSGEFVSYQLPVGTYGTYVGFDVGFFGKYSVKTHSFFIPPKII